MFLEKPKVDMEAAYGLHYPGEVLERIEGCLTLTKQTPPRTCLAEMMPQEDLCSMELKRICSGKDKTD